MTVVIANRGPATRCLPYRAADDRLTTLQVPEGRTETDQATYSAVLAYGRNAGLFTGPSAELSVEVVEEPTPAQVDVARAEPEPAPEPVRRTGRQRRQG